MTESDTLPDITVRSQIIPLAGMKLLLPTTCIAEIVAWQTPEPLDDAPEWLLGEVTWRGLRIPLLSFEAANGLACGEVARGSRIVVLNALSGDAERPFYALQIQGIPHLALLDGANIEAISEPSDRLPLVLEYVTAQEQDVLIPDQDKLEALIKSAGLTVSALETVEESAEE